METDVAEEVIHPAPEHAAKIRELSILRARRHDDPGTQAKRGNGVERFFLQIAKRGVEHDHRPRLQELVALVSGPVDELALLVGAGLPMDLPIAGDRSTSREANLNIVTRRRCRSLSGMTLNYYYRAA